MLNQGGLNPTPQIPAPQIPAAEGQPLRSSAAANPSGETAPAEEGLPGRLGPYKIIKRLARGGMGEVLLGMDETLNRPAAIKRMARNQLDDADSVERFKREARATAAAVHPNIAMIYFVGTDEENLPFLAMEFVEGPTLFRVMRDHVHTAYSTMCEWMIQTSQGLQAALKVNIIHRDLKPANLMLSKDGVIKIVDFGLAKIFREDTHKTMTGMVLGTPQYMSPEQSQGRMLDHRSDIYSLGATFYHLLSGRPPFDGSSMIDIMMKHVTAPLMPLYSVNPAVPLPFCDAIHKMMSKNPDDRQQNYEDLIIELKAVKLQLIAKEKNTLHGDNLYDHSAATRKMPGGAGEMASAGGFGGTGAPGATGGDGRMNGASLESNAPDADADLKAIVGSSGRSMASKHNVNDAADADAKIHTMTVEAAGGAEHDGGKHFWGTKHLLIAGGAVFLLILLILPSLLKNDQENSAQTAAAAPPPTGLASVFKRLMAPSGPPTPIQAPPELLAARHTYHAIQEICRAIESYENSAKRFPDSLKEVLDYGLLTRENLMDGWNQEIEFRNSTRQIISTGADGREGTEDDFLVTIGDPVPMPLKYQEMEKDVRKQQGLPAPGS